MADLEMWNLVVGFFTPLVIALLLQPRWPDWLRSIGAFVFCVLVGSVTYLLKGGVLDFSGLRKAATSVLTILVVSISTYHGIWKPTGVAPRIERATSRGRHTA